MLIRAATPADIPAITRIYDGAVRHGTASFELVPPTESEMLRRFEGLMAGNYPYLAAVDEDGTLLGYAYAGAFRLRPAYRFLVEDSIYVAPDAQGRGVGRALLNALIAACEERGFRQMVGVVGDSANGGSIGVHRSCGFRDVGIIQSAGLKFGRWLDIVLMQRDLGEGDTTLPPA